jgi:hypothetical protein
MGSDYHPLLGSGTLANQQQPHFPISEISIRMVQLKSEETQANRDSKFNYRLVSQFPILNPFDDH